MWGRGSINSLRNWIIVLPFEQVVKYPELIITYIWLHFLEGNSKEYKKILDIDLNLVTQKMDVTQREIFLSKFALMKGNIASANWDVQEAEDAFKEITHLPENDWLWQSMKFLLSGWIYEIASRNNTND